METKRKGELLPFETTLLAKRAPLRGPTKYRRPPSQSLRFPHWQHSRSRMGPQIRGLPAVVFLSRRHLAPQIHPQAPRLKPGRCRRRTPKSSLTHRSSLHPFLRKTSISDKGSTCQMLRTAISSTMLLCENQLKVYPLNIRYLKTNRLTHGASTSRCQISPDFGVQRLTPVSCQTKFPFAEAGPVDVGEPSPKAARLAHELSV